MIEIWFHERVKTMFLKKRRKQVAKYLKKYYASKIFSVIESHLNKNKLLLTNFSASLYYVIHVIYIYIFNYLYVRSHITWTDASVFIIILMLKKVRLMVAPYEIYGDSNVYICFLVFFKYFLGSNCCTIWQIAV